MLGTNLLSCFFLDLCRTRNSFTYNHISFHISSWKLEKVLVGIRYFAIKVSQSHAASLSVNDFFLLSHGFKHNHVDMLCSSGSHALVTT